MKLLNHNQKTLEEVKDFTSQGLNCCVVNPCGSGKTSIMAQFIEDNPVSTFTIITKQKNAAQYYQQKSKVFSEHRVSIMTFNKMMNDFKAKEIENYNTDYLLIDEAHYIGANKWRDAFTSITEKYKPIIIGFTATPQRYEDQGTDNDIIMEFFDGHSAGNFSTKQLEKDGVFVEPEYVLSIYNLQSIIDKKIVQIEDSDLDDDEKEPIYQKLDALLNKWNNESKPEKIFAEYLPNFMYKDICNRILVYVSDITELPAKKRYIDNALRNIFPDKSITSYTYTYKTSENELRKFLKEDKRSDIKVLYSIDKIMETIHIDDLRIVIMLRPSVSNRIITQQFGRINNIINRNKPIIIDMVDNLSNISYSTADDKKEYDKSDTNCSSKKSLYMPHISYCAEVFSNIDKVLSRFQYFQYQDFTGTLKDICEVYRKRYEEVRELIKTHTLEESLQLASSINTKITQNIFDDTDTVNEKDFKLNEEQCKYAENTIYIVDDFIKRRNINDDDWIQRLYLYFLHCVYNTDGKFDKDFIRKQRLQSCLRERYIKMHKHRLIRDSLFIDLYEYIKDDTMSYNNVKYELGSKIFLELTDSLLKNKLSELDQEIIQKRYGLYDKKCETLEQIAKNLHVTKERIRQRELKALTKLRRTSESRLLRDLAHDVEQERNNYNENQALSRLWLC